jgi:hypothetical protein
LNALEEFQRPSLKSVCLWDCLAADTYQVTSRTIIKKRCDQTAVYDAPLFKVKGDGPHFLDSQRSCLTAAYIEEGGNVVRDLRANISKALDEMGKLTDPMFGNVAPDMKPSNWSSTCHRATMCGGHGTKNRILHTVGDPQPKGACRPRR